MNRYKSLIKFDKQIYVVSASSVVGSKELNGPLGEYFDITMSDDRFGMKTYEQAESEMVRMAYNCCLKKCKDNNLSPDLIIGGDLQNQCVAHSFAMSDTQIPYLGIYGACSSMAQGLGMASVFLASNNFKNVLCSASSHFSTSERQFRFPLEYGLQRTPTSQTTVTGAGSFLLSVHQASDICITAALFGSIKDNGIKDANNMGAAMAGAALDTLQRYFMQSEYKEKDFDLIATGDLGIEGSAILRESAHLYSLNLGDNYKDCGELIYDSAAQSIGAGGSGCGCSAVVTAGYIIKKMQSNDFKKVLLVGTGALLSSGSVLQRLSIPGIAHLVEFTRR